MSHWKVGFHDGAGGGNSNGLGDLFTTLDTAGIPVTMVSADTAGPLYELQVLAKASGVKHVMAWRDSVHGLDVPKYHLDPVVAAQLHWQALLGYWPPELDPRYVWIIPINECDKNRADWLGRFGVAFADLAVPAGFKVLLPGWSGGEPEYEHWETPGQLAYLRRCAQDPEKVGVALHEYSFRTDYLVDDTPYYLVGRFQQMFDVCDKNSIRRPIVLISEFGWTLNDAPGVDEAMRQLNWAAVLYGRHPTVIGAALWYLGPGYGGIADKVQPLIEPVTQEAVRWGPPDETKPEPPVEPPTAPGKDKEIIAKVPQPRDYTLEEYLQIAATLFPKGRVMSPAHTATLAMLAAGNPESYAEVWEPYLPSQVQTIQFIEAAGYRWEPHSIYAPKELVLTHFPTDSQTFTQPFAANPQNYAHYCDANGVCLKGHNGVDLRAILGARIMNAVKGTVEWVGDHSPNGGLSDYGWHVRVRHASGALLIYAHLSPSIQVEVGWQIDGGLILGFSGNTGRSTGAHLHFEIRLCPGLPDWPWCTVDPTPYLQPLLDDPAPLPGVDMTPYLQVVDSGVGPFFVLQHHDGVTENIQMRVQDGRIYAVKGDNYEEFRIEGGYIERGTDSSHGPDTAYRLDDGYGWSRWMPKLWSVGDVFWRSPTVIYFQKSNCAVLSQHPNTLSYLRFDKFHLEWTSPPSGASPNGVTLANVVECSYGFDPATPPIENYKFAYKVGYPVEWYNNAGAHSWISEIPLGRDPLPLNLLDCL